MIFVTGGAGYIGSHTCVELLNAGHQVTVFDNFSNSQPEALRRIERITGKQLQVIEGDIRNPAELKTALQTSGAQAVIHFAGLKAVGESEQQPLRYYENNVQGTLTLLQAMQSCAVKTIVFSSSATVYGIPQFLPYTEAHPLSATNTYGQTKLTVERMLQDLYRSDATWRIGILRYFNPVGAHASGLIGEDPQGLPNNLMPFVAQVAVGRREFLNVWGNDYDTPDGTGVRDYIHVVDLALGHLAALNRLQAQPQCMTVNLGTGIGYSVLDMVRAFEQACGKPIAFQFSPRRAGDIASYCADPKLAAEHTWRWQSQNPQGYSISH
ncbi:MAG: UDP-glucose 4-epimerase [Comamonadaceae bacterium]|nr:MAG: UDP-glucose 4-epimerase [Comamonadaceae bacterium]